jgi:hypothetical protein
MYEGYKSMKTYEVRYLVEDIVFEVEAENEDEAEAKCDKLLKELAIGDISTYEVQIDSVDF